MFNAMAKVHLPRVCRTTTALSSRTSRARSCSSITTSITAPTSPAPTTAPDGLAEARAQERLRAGSPRSRRRWRSTCRATCCTRCSGRTWRPGAGGEPTGALADADDAATSASFARFRAELTNAAMTIMGSGWAALVLGSGQQAAADRADSRSPERDHAGGRPDPGARRLGARLLPAIRPRQEDASSRRSGTSGTGRTSDAGSRRFAASTWPCNGRPDRRRRILVNKTAQNLPCGDSMS